jgi:hypothetical protein
VDDDPLRIAHRECAVVEEQRLTILTPGGKPPRVAADRLPERRRNWRTRGD